MSIQHKVLPGDLNEARRLLECIDDCIYLQWKAIKENDQSYINWTKETHRAVKDLHALYDKKKRFDKEIGKVQKLVLNLQSRGINASVVARAHSLTI